MKTTELKCHENYKDEEVEDGLTPQERDWNRRFQKNGLIGMMESGSVKGIDRGEMIV